MMLPSQQVGIAKLVESMLHRKFIHFGKPDSQMFMYAFKQLTEEIGAIDKKDISHGW